MARITFNTMYDNTMRNIQRNANTLNRLNEQIASTKRINRPSDNPVGFTQSMTYKNSLNSLGQKKINIDDGVIFMTTMETTHASMNDVFGRCKDLAVQGSNDTLTHDNRLYINMDVRQSLEQMVALSQTKHKDGYMFSGKWTNQPPYEIKSGQAEYRYPAANATTPINPLHDPADPTSPRIFQDTGPITISIFDSNYRDPNISPDYNYPNNLFAPKAERIIPGSVQLDLEPPLMEKPFRYADLPEDDERLLLGYEPPLPDPNAAPVYMTKAHPDYYKSDYEIDYVNGTITLISERAKEAFYDTSGFTAGDTEVPIKQPAGSPPATVGYPNMPGMKFDYIYRNSIDMSGEILREIDPGITVKINSNPDDLFGKGTPGSYDPQTNGQTDAFKEIIALMQGLWHNDQSQIAQSIDTVDVARKRNLAEQAISGSKINRMEMVYDRNAQISINDTDALSRVEDTEFTEAITQFAMADYVYSASLNAAAKLMRNSLMDYL